MAGSPSPCPASTWEGHVSREAKGKTLRPRCLHLPHSSIYLQPQGGVGWLSGSLLGASLLSVPLQWGVWGPCEETGT